MCTYQEYFTICEVVKRFNGSSIWSVICPTINDLIDCKPVAPRLAAQVGGARHGATAEAQVCCFISDVSWSEAGAHGQHSH